MIKFQISVDAWGTLVAGLLSRWPRAVRLLASQTRLEATRAPVRRTHRPISHLLALHRTPRRELSRPPLPTEHRSCRARTPPRKRVAPSACSLSVTPPPPSPLSRVIRASVRAYSPFFPTVAMAEVHRSWRSTRPTTTADFPSPPLCSVSLVVNSGSSSPA